MQLLCKMFGHHRSLDRVQPWGQNGWRSRCRHCNAPMIRISHGEWTVADYDMWCDPDKGGEARDAA